MKLRIALFLFGSALIVSAQDADVTKRLEAAASAFSEAMQIRDRAIPQDLLDKAHCAVIVPGLKKGAFIVGAKYGRGFVSCRKEGGAGWSAPAGIRIEGGSIGFQIGGSETDVIMLVMNERGANRLFNSQFTLGGDASVAAGPVGRSTTAQTDAYMTAEILSWSRSRGAFAGVSLQGATLRQDRDVNRSMYGQAWDTKQIVDSGAEPPAGADQLMAQLNKYSSRK
jgi:SH3 domain-containing YSC84-like protein 1